MATQTESPQGEPRDKRGIAQVTATEKRALSRLRKWQKWLRRLQRVKTPNPWTMH